MYTTRVVMLTTLLVARRTHIIVRQNTKQLMDARRLKQQRKQATEKWSKSRG